MLTHDVGGSAEAINDNGKVSQGHALVPMTSPSELPMTVIEFFARQAHISPPKVREKMGAWKG